MTLQLELPIELEKRLRARASESGQNIERYALDALQEKLAAAKFPETTAERAAWRKKFEEFINTPRPTMSSQMDDSRESIYEGCGE